MNLRLESCMRMLSGKHVLIGVSGGIAAYKIPELVRLLRKCGAEVRVICTESAERFVTRETLETLSRHQVRGQWDGQWGGRRGAHDVAMGIEHIEWARWGDVFLVAPATANVMAKLAHGIADDELTTELLAFRGPKLLAPAMNPTMWSHVATQRNALQLAQDGWRLLGPDAGDTACGEEGLGRMVEPETLLESLARCFYGDSKCRALISLGPTRSDVDPVRYITNRSSGKMGAALAWAAVERGWEVTVVRGAVACVHVAPLPLAVRVVEATTTQQMKAQVEKEFARSDIFFSAAAVLDWEAASPASLKIKKNRTALSQHPFEMKASPDILAAIGKKKKSGQRVVGFAAETMDGSTGDAERGAIAAAREKLRNKGCDAVFVNPVAPAATATTGFETDRNAGWWVTSGSVVRMEPTSKLQLARGMIANLETP